MPEEDGRSVSVYMTKRRQAWGVFTAFLRNFDRKPSLDLSRETPTKQHEGQRPASLSSISSFVDLHLAGACWVYRNVDHSAFGKAATTFFKMLALPSRLLLNEKPVPPLYDLAGACWASRNDHHGAVGKVGGYDLLEDAGLVKPSVLGGLGYGRPQLAVGRLGRNTPVTFFGRRKRNLVSSNHVLRSFSASKR